MPKNSLAKARALRIGLGSHKKDTLARYRNFITIAVVAGSVAWLAASYLSPQKMASRFSPGGFQCACKLKLRPLSRFHRATKRRNVSVTMAKSKRETK
jgi:hypothetical protein